MLLYLEGVGPWIRFPDTVHEGLAHLPETLSKSQYCIPNSHIIEESLKNSLKNTTFEEKLKFLVKNIFLSSIWICFLVNLIKTEPRVAQYGRSVTLYGHSVTTHGHSVTLYGHSVTHNGHSVMHYGHSVTTYGQSVTHNGHSVTHYGHSVTYYGHSVTHYGHSVTHYWHWVIPH